MSRTLILVILFVFFYNNAYAQSIDDSFPLRKMTVDLEFFKSIREKANSGLYTYRSKAQIDSIYQEAFLKLPLLKSYREFYTLLINLTAYEGSIHNSTSWSKELLSSLKSEEKGYFPLPLKIIQGKLLVNITGSEIPLGSEILSINGNENNELISVLGNYYTTDGFNQTGKKVGLDKHLSKYYRYYYGLSSEFEITHKFPSEDYVQTTIIQSVSYKKYYENFNLRHSIILDRILYEDISEDEYYSFEKINSSTGILTINSFSLGSEKSESHLKFKTFIDSVMIDLNQNEFSNLIIDIRNNGGGNPPNDMLTLSYLVDSPQKEVESAWISFTEEVPYWRHFQLDIPFFFRPIAKSKLKKIMKQELPIVRDNKRYYKDIVVHQPSINKFDGQTYLLIGPAVASAASLFAAMVSSNSDAIIVGEETGGGYYGHNGSFPVVYKLPKSNISTSFSIVNITQDVIEKENQLLGSGVMPDFPIEQSVADFKNNIDSQLNYTLKLLGKAN